MLNNNILQIVKEYVYFGILFTNTRRFYKVQYILTSQATRAMYAEQLDC